MSQGYLLAKEECEYITAGEFDPVTMKFVRKVSRKMPSSYPKDVPMPPKDWRIAFVLCSHSYKQGDRVADQYVIQWLGKKDSSAKKSPGEQYMEAVKEAGWELTTPYVSGFSAQKNGGRQTLYVSTSEPTSNEDKKEVFPDADSYLFVDAKNWR